MTAPIIVKLLQVYVIVCLFVCLTRRIVGCCFSVVYAVRYASAYLFMRDLCVRFCYVVFFIGMHVCSVFCVVSIGGQSIDFIAWWMYLNYAQSVLRYCYVLRYLSGYYKKEKVPFNIFCQLLPTIYRHHDKTKAFIYSTETKTKARKSMFQ